MNLTHIVEIMGYSSNGEGVARLPEGKVAFIPGGVRGDVLEVRLIREKPRSVNAEIVRILTPSLHRVEPDCPVYPLCGGCNFRHITYEEELWAKRSRVNDALFRIGGFSVSIDEVITTGKTDGYRNRAVFHSDGVRRGFYAPRSHDIIPVDRCLLLKDEINDALSEIPLDEAEIALYSGKDGSEKVGVRKGDSGKDVIEKAGAGKDVIEEGVAGKDGAGKDNVEIDAPGKYIPGKGDAGKDGAVEHSSGEDETGEYENGKEESAGNLEEELDGLTFEMTGFFQVNVEAALLLYNKARQYAAMAPDETLIDLYCGVGSLTLFIGRDAGRVIGVDINTDAIDTARKNARRNGFSHVEFIAADASDWEPSGTLNRDTSGASGWNQFDKCEWSSYDTLDRGTSDTLDKGTSDTLDRSTSDALDRSTSDALDGGTSDTLDRSSSEKLEWRISDTLERSLARRPDCIVVDPPRKGLSPSVAQKILKLAPKRIVYISCDPATLARDLRVLKGYDIKELCAVDMFPRTANIECCCLLS